MAKYVLDEPDEGGMRCLLRIAGDQLGGNNDIVIRQNPKGSFYIISINHPGVLKNYAWKKLIQDSVFIEDLGPTNGISLNVKAIEDKRLATLNQSGPDYY